MTETIHINLWHGDCREQLKRIADDSVDLILADPPYGLEFMGKEWDKLWTARPGMSKPGIGERKTEWPAFGGAVEFGGYNPTCQGCGGRQRGKRKCTCAKPDWYVRGEQVESGALYGRMLAVRNAQAMQAWHLTWLAEVYRVLKPGGTIKVFSATRTFHRVCVAMEAAGFEGVKDNMEAWTYGCLDDQSEILTENGWKRGVAVEVGERVACWRSKTETISLRPIEETIRAPFCGDMIRLVNDNTDQMLTPNHRVYKRHRVRTMEDGVRVATFETEWAEIEAAEINRWNTINLPLSGYHEGAGLDGGVRYAELLAWVWTEGGFDHAPSTGVRIYQSTRINGSGVEDVAAIHALVAELVPGFKHYERERFYRGKPYMEHCWFFTGEMAARIRTDLPNKHPTWGLLWQMSLAEKEAFLHTAMRGDGREETKEFYQKDDADREWYQTLAHLIGWQARDNPRKRYVSLHENPKTQLQIRHLKKHDREHYEGVVWCVRVETGAFLARRNGRIFVTGNSGFPKSLNISKALKKLVTKDSSITPEMIEKWKGHGTALKPAWEPIVCGRKPG